MCRNTTLKNPNSASAEFGCQDTSATNREKSAAPSILARYTCASILMGFFAVWGKYTFVPEAEQPGIHAPMHSYKVPLALTVGYLVSLPILRYVVDNFVSKKTDMKVLLTESMILVRSHLASSLLLIFQFERWSEYWKIGMYDRRCVLGNCFVLRPFFVFCVVVTDMNMCVPLGMYLFELSLSLMLCFFLTLSLSHHLSLFTVQCCASIPQRLDGLPIRQCRSVPGSSFHRRYFHCQHWGSFRRLCTLHGQVFGVF